MHDAAQYLWSDIARKKVILTPPALNKNNFSHQSLDNRNFDIGFKILSTLKIWCKNFLN